jgi:hypothetical protein
MEDEDYDGNDKKSAFGIFRGGDACGYGLG